MNKLTEDTTVKAITTFLLDVSRDKRDALFQKAKSRKIEMVND